MLLQHKLGQELADALHIEKLDNIHLFNKLIAGLAMPLEALYLTFGALSVLEDTADPT